jgi:hypothetical protein
MVDLAILSPRIANSSNEADLVKSGFGGEHMESNHRLMYTCAWASPQKCHAPAEFALAKLHLRTVS